MELKPGDRVHLNATGQHVLKRGARCGRFERYARDKLGHTRFARVIWDGNTTAETLSRQYVGFIERPLVSHGTAKK